MAGVAAAGWSVPRLALEPGEVAEVWGRFAARGVERVAVAGFDEDAVTLAAEAGKRALDAWGGAPQDVDLVLLSTTHRDEGAATTVAEALGLQGASPEVVLGAGAAPVQALARAADHADARGLPVLVVASDAPRGAPDDPGQHGLGAGAAALVVTPDGDAEVGGLAVGHRESPGRDRVDEHGFRRSHPVGDLSVEALQDALDRVHPAPGEAHLACASPLGPVQGQVAGEVVNVRRVSGEVPGAGPLLSLVEALDRGEGPVLVAGAGGGTGAVLTVTPTAPVPGAGGVVTALEAATPVAYHRFLRERELLPPRPPEVEHPMGAYVSLADYAESVGARYRLEAQRCTACSELVFPPRPACPDCGASSFETERLDGAGSVYSVTSIGRGGAPSEFAREQAMTGAYAVAIVELAEGPRVVARLTDRDPSAWSIGDAVEPVFRKLYTQEDAPRYGLKFRPPVER